MLSRKKLAVAVIAASALIGSSSPAFAATLNGSGATFAQPLIDACKVDFSKETGHTINYTGGGSGKGRTDFSGNLVNFAGSDTPYTSGEPAGLIYAPIYAAPVAVMYNLPTIKEAIYLSPSTIAQIFSGYITNWDDKLIAADNERTVRTPIFKTVKKTVKDKNGKVSQFKAEGSKKNNDADAEQFLLSCKDALFTVNDVQKKPSKKSPAAPFTTSTLQQEASRKLGYGVSKTMLLAQKLYEAGHITYMRTDSVNLSETALKDITSAIVSNYGKDFLQTRKYKNKNESAQEAHEAIRPTYMDKSKVDTADAQKLYDLIWKRTMASQMADAELEKTVAEISISTNAELLKAEGEVLKFEGFLKVYNEGKDEEENEEEQNEGILPPLEKGQQLDLMQLLATERFSRPPSRYTEASLVKKLEELGIGRPSTYAPTISTILKRGYVEKRDREGVKRNYAVIALKEGKISRAIEQENTGAEKSKLFPTDLGAVVTDFLIQHFNQILDYGFTASIENEFDNIAEGSEDWSEMLKNFYSPFKKGADETMEKAERISGERDLGIDPATGKKVIARMGRYGPMVQIGGSSEEDKPRFAKLKTDQSIETIVLEEALELFKLPRILGEFESETVQVNIGRFGPYIAHGKNFYSLAKEFDPYEIKLETAIPIIEEKRKAKSERTIKLFEKEKIQLLRGPYGPYIKKGLRNFPIPKENHDRVNDLTLEEVQAMIEHAIANPSKGKRRAVKKSS